MYLAPVALESILHVFHFSTLQRTVNRMIIHVNIKGIYRTNMHRTVLAMVARQSKFSYRWITVNILQTNYILLRVWNFSLFRRGFLLFYSRLLWSWMRGNDDYSCPSAEFGAGRYPCLDCAHMYVFKQRLLSFCKTNKPGIPMPWSQSWLLDRSLSWYGISVTWCTIHATDSLSETCVDNVVQFRAEPEVSHMAKVDKQRVHFGHISSGSTQNCTEFSIQVCDKRSCLCSIQAKDCLWWKSLS